MSIGTILLIVLILILIGVIPTWPHARSWGYGPERNRRRAAAGRARPVPDGATVTPRSGNMAFHSKEPT